MGLVAWINADGATNDAESSPRSPSIVQFFVALINSAVLFLFASACAYYVFFTGIGPEPDTGADRGFDLSLVAIGILGLLLFVASYAAAYYITGSRKGLWIPIVLTVVSLSPVVTFAILVVAKLLLVRRWN